MLLSYVLGKGKARLKLPQSGARGKLFEEANIKKVTRLR